MIDGVWWRADESGFPADNDHAAPGWDHPVQHGAIIERFGRADFYTTNGTSAVLTRTAVTSDPTGCTP